MSRIGVITDEISEDFEHALAVCTDLGIRDIELRSVWGSSIVELSDDDLLRMEQHIRDGGFAVCSIASPYLKCHVSGDGDAAGRTHSAASAPRVAQPAILERSLEVAQRFDAPLVRAFSFWRVPDPSSVRDDLLHTLREATERVSKTGKMLGLENEYACNIATGAEAAWYLGRIPDRTLGLIWDPGNIVALGEAPGPVDFAHVSGRIHHVHVKDGVALGSTGFTTIGNGVTSWGEQLQLLVSSGYDGVLSLETHFDLEGSREAATRACTAALRDEMKRATQ
jgi:L-ribulose-5-phosphate 3-epimerase